MATSFHYSDLVPSWAKASEILKGDIAGHEFHGNQYTQVGASGSTEPMSKERLADLANLYIKVSRLNPATSVGRAVTDPFMIRRSCFEAELHARLSGEHIPSEWKVGSVINHADPEQQAQAIKDADDFMRAISDNSKVYPVLQRGFFDKGGELVKQFVEGKTIDLPLASFSTDPEVASTYAQGGRGPMNIGDGNNNVVIHTIDAVGGTLAPYTNIPYWQSQVLTGGRFIVDKVETTKASFGGGNYVEVLLRQESFVAKAVGTNWKISHPNLFPTWFPNNFNPNMVIASALSDSDEPITKGDVVGHEFHGNQHTGGLGGEATPLSDKEKEDLNTWSEEADGMGSPSRGALEKIALKANEKAPELFRGIQLEPQDYRELMKSLKVGATIKLPFSSWSENRMVGEQFASEDSPMGIMGEKGVVFHIAEGTRGANVAPYAVEQFQYQKEWLIPERGFRVVSVTENAPDAPPEQDPTFPDWAFDVRRDWSHTLVELEPL